MKKLLVVLVVMGFSISAFSQTSVSGKVLEKDTEIPLLGASVLVKGTTTGTTTDFDGNYSLSEVGNDAVLEFSYIGFKTLEIPVSGQSTINVALEEDGELLDEVVVTVLKIQRDKESLGVNLQIKVDH